MPLPFSRQTALALAGILGIGLLVAARFLPGDGPRSPARQAAAPLVARAKAPAARVLVVDVAGAVRRPGLYRLPEGARVADAIVRAGGPTRRAATALVNRAAPLVDGQQVVVPAASGARPPGAPGSAAATPGGVSSTPVSLASATLEQLDALPGVGPVTAQKIIGYRAEHGPFRSVEELDAIPGIGPARIEQLRDLVTP